MALDEPNELDQQFDVDGFKYIVNKDFFHRAQPIKVDFQTYGFKLDCAIEFSAGGCSGCGTSKSSSCGC